ncbi:winged helix DNA-binding protein [Sphingosinicella sp. LHD-64]|uniref:winged helix DNA-binding protein n=1 Tax=Sphingosinicella sp. LHD-64 TaxID=3072139 RepID=UPI00280E7B1C|nr:winged helix DNA-binding protein [Sphingosinicella sp. LHD-64]MDQ8757929.1 winged helix DNA-binding protein [Sphingosinicella sp. LHD-64]
MAHDALMMIEYGDDQPLLVFGDTQIALDQARRDAEVAGFRVVRSDLVSAFDTVDQAAPAPIFLNLDGHVAREALVGLLDRMEMDAQSGRPGIVAAPRGMIDVIAAHAFHSSITHLCEAPEPARLLALRLASMRRPERLHDVNREGDALMQHALLHQLSEEVGRIAGILASLSEDEEAARAGPGKMHASDDDFADIDAGHIRAIIRARRLRDQFFRNDLFADPAWDMLLDLMAARIEKGRVAVSSLCIAAAVPPTTALRWIKALTDRGLFVRSADPLDGRRVYIELSDEAARSVAAYLRAAQRLAPTVI